MTTPYSPATVTALAMGATDAGFVENDPSVPWDTSAARFNAQTVEERMARLLLDQRDNIDLLRRQVLGAPTTTVKIMTAGDSITVGFGSTDGQGWRGALASQLGRRRIQPAMSMCAHGGWTLGDLTAALPAALAANTPDLVLVNIGTNDWAGDPAAYQASYVQMIDLILASSPTVRVACAVIPISQATGIQESQQRVNTAVRAAVGQRAGTGRVALSDHTTTTQARWTTDATEPGSYPPPGRWTFDGVHPTDAAYLQMAQQWLTTIQPWVPGLTL